MTGSSTLVVMKGPLLMTTLDTVLGDSLNVTIQDISKPS